MGDDPTPDDLVSKFEAIERLLTTRRREVGDEPGKSTRERPGPDVPAVSRRPRHSRPPRKQVIIGSLIALALAVGGTAAALTRSDTADGANPQPSSTPAYGTTTLAPTAAEQEAAQWVSSAVGPTHEVACDADLCALLRQYGVTATSVITSNADVSAIAGADVVITTAAGRAGLGSTLTRITSAETLAAFGTGADRVEVAVVAPGGAADYGQRLAQDRADRKRVGLDLVHNPRITLSGPGLVTALADGRVDSRLCSLLALLGASHTVTVASFTPAGPGAGPDFPAATMIVTAVDGRSAIGDSPQARALLALLAAQQPPYRPAAAVAETAGLRIAFAQPEPLGLAGGAKS